MPFLSPSLPADSETCSAKLISALPRPALLLYGFIRFDVKFNYRGAFDLRDSDVKITFTTFVRHEYVALHYRA